VSSLCTIASFHFYRRTSSDAGHLALFVDCGSALARCSVAGVGDRVGTDRVLLLLMNMPVLGALLMRPRGCAGSALLGRGGSREPFGASRGGRSRGAASRFDGLV